MASKKTKVSAQSGDPDRRERHAKLRELLSEGSYSNQTAVAKALARAGYEVTQASVSRDFNELGVVKVQGRYRFQLPAVEPTLPAVHSLVRKCDVAGDNLVVVRTAIGSANTVAIRVDYESLPGVIGTVAGDDTILVAVKDRSSQRNFLKFMQEAF